MRLSAGFLLLLSLAACSTTGYRYQTAPTPLPELSKATLHSPVTIRADRAREYIQGGDRRLQQQLTLWNVHCSLVLRTLSEEERTVQPDTFAITRIHRDRFMAGRHGVMLAMGGGDYNPVMSTTILELHSDRQPDVYRIECEIMDEPWRARHVTIEQMRATLGDLITLE